MTVNSPHVNDALDCLTSFVSGSQGECGYLGVRDEFPLLLLLSFLPVI